MSKQSRLNKARAEKEKATASQGSQDNRQSRPQPSEQKVQADNDAQRSPPPDRSEGGLSRHQGDRRG